MNFSFVLVFFWLGCALGEQDCKKLKPGTKLEIPGDCRRYLICHLYGFAFICPGGKIFSKGKCDWPNNTERRECWGVKKLTLTAPTPKVMTSAATRTTLKKATARPTSISPPKASNCSKVDPSDPNLLEIPNDCYHFIMCNNRKPVVMACPVGTVFNPKNRICDWPWNAGRQCGPPKLKEIVDKIIINIYNLIFRDDLSISVLK